MYFGNFIFLPLHIGSMFSYFNLNIHCIELSEIKQQFIVLHIIITYYGASGLSFGKSLR